MAICPIGHESGTDDYCEVCGRLMSAQGQQPPAGQQPSGFGQQGRQGPYNRPEPHLPPPPPGVSPYPGASDPDATAAVEVCPNCKTPREGQEPFCEGCRWNFVTGGPGRHQPPPPGSRLPPPHPHGGRPPVPSGAGGPSAPSWPAPPPSHGQAHQQAVPYPEPQAPPPGPGQPPPTAPPAPSTPLPPRAHPDPPFPPAPVPPSPVPSAPAPAPPPGEGPAQSAGGRPAPVPQASAPPGADFVIAPPSGGGGHSQAPPPGGSGHREEPPGRTTSWFVVVSADREYFAAMMARSGPEAQGLFFPPYCPERRFELAGNQLRIGRMRHRPNEQAPDIDLSKPPEDPGVSHKHAVLVQQPDGTWALVDQDSTNGTLVNGSDDSVKPWVPVQLKEGDRVHVGAWTTITLHRADR